MYLLTRPLPKLKASVSAFEQAGLAVVGVATTDITPAPEGEADLSRYLQNGVAPDAIIVTSVFAASSLIQHVQADTAGHALLKCPVITVGRATARLLGPVFSRVITPESHTSEGILSLPLLKSAKCQQIVIIKGEGGRTALHDTLTTRGKQVITFNLYKRCELECPVVSKTFGMNEIRGIIATSEELGLHLLQQYRQDGISNKPWLTVSERVAVSLRTQGIHDIRACAGASDGVLIEWIKNNWE